LLFFAAQAQFRSKNKRGTAQLPQQPAGLNYASPVEYTIAGIEVMESRIGYLAFAEEIASAMLKRQQAEAIVAARFKIVEGAVSMVEMALNDLTGKNIVHFDEEKKASMASNLMVVLCSDKEVTPVVNTGTLYQ
jgi:hypothetical protein